MPAAHDRHSAALEIVCHALPSRQRGRLAGPGSRATGEQIVAAARRATTRLTPPAPASASTAKASR